MLWLFFTTWIKTQFGITLNKEIETGNSTWKQIHKDCSKYHRNRKTKLNPIELGPCIVHKMNPSQITSILFKDVVYSRQFLSLFNFLVFYKVFCNHKFKTNWKYFKPVASLFFHHFWLWLRDECYLFILDQ